MARLIRASELAEYVYCHRAWWLRTIEDLVPEAQERLWHGTNQHHHHGRLVLMSSVLLTAGLLLVAISLVALMFGG
jgi:hypothetical protein